MQTSVIDVKGYLTGRSRWDILSRGRVIFIDGFVRKIREEHYVVEKPVLDIYFDPRQLYNRRLGFCGRTRQALAFRDLNLELNDTPLANAIDFSLKYVDETINWEDNMEIITRYKSIIEPIADYFVKTLYEAWDGVSLELLQSKIEVE